RQEQVVELPPVVAEVTEYRLERHHCSLCGETTEGVRPADAPKGGFGPRLMAFAAMLTGVYHISRARTVQLLRDGFGVRISTGALSTCERRVTDALAASHGEAQRHVEAAATRYVDATTWFSNGARAAVWVVATATVTLLAITAQASRKALLGLIGRVTGRVVCDRATVFNVWTGSSRQTCWAHLLRYFEAMSQRDGPSARIGERLCTMTLAMFSLWHDFKRGELTRAALRAAIHEPRGQPEPQVFTERVREVLTEGTTCGHLETEGTCRNLLDKHWEALWTFIEVDDVEPTNNHAERELRSTVMWRQRSFGSQSERGDHFAERIGTVARTLRKQQRPLHAFLVDSLETAANGRPAPTLVLQD
ncbi:MAG: IS66 family transposase, partial [Reyranella sp.]|nr:IS66 family transposase [Reyranella sp.]